MREGKCHSRPFLLVPHPSRERSDRSHPSSLQPGAFMSLTIVRHPLAQHYLTHLRDQSTKPALFRTLTRKLTTLLVIEASRDLRTAQQRIRTPLAEIDSPVLAEELVIVPILRAG